MERIWGAIKQGLKNKIPPSGFQLWIEPIEMEAGPPGVLQLGCPNTFFMHWVRSHYLFLIQEEARRQAGSDLSIDLCILPEQPRRLVLPAAHQPTLPLLKAHKPFSRQLNRTFTFDQFVVGASNRFAFQASKALANDDALYGRTIFLTSLPGLGKSHLSQAVGNHTNQQDRVIYLTAEDFANEMVQSLRQGQMERFKEKFRRQCDVLLLEGVHFLSGKEKIQAELCYTLDCLADQGKKLVFTSPYLPQEIPSLKKELQSRLSGGVITPINPPDFSTRVNILIQKANQRQTQVPTEVLEYLASCLTQDIRQMLSALGNLLAKSSLLRKQINLALAEEVVRDFQASTFSISVEAIQQLTCKVYKLTLPELTGPSRKKGLVRTRNLAIYLCRHYTQKTLKDLARAFHRTHSTVLHALESIEQEIKQSSGVAQELEFLEQKIHNLFPARASTHSRAGCLTRPGTEVLPGVANHLPLHNKDDILTDICR